MSPICPTSSQAAGREAQQIKMLNSDEALLTERVTNQSHTGSKHITNQPYPNLFMPADTNHADPPSRVTRVRVIKKNKKKQQD